MSGSFRISKLKTPVAVEMVTGRSFDGFVHTKLDERLLDLLNDTRNFIPISLLTGEVKIVQKASIAEMTETDAPIAEKVRAEKPAWERSESVNGFSAGEMSLDEARMILGVPTEYSADKVHDAHRQILGRIHPDRGGSDYLAAKVNVARDILVQAL